MQHRKVSSHIQWGSSLIEVLVTIVILSFGILALTGMQVFAVAANQNVVAQGLAASMAFDYAEMVRANPAAFLTDGYNRAASFDATDTGVIAVTAAETCVYPACTSTSLAIYEVAMMKARLKANLRAGTYAFTRPIEAGVASTSHADLWIMWTERRTSGAASSETNFDKCPAAVVNTTLMPRCFYMRVTL